MVHVFIVGSKGIPAKYGGFETFVEQLTAGKRHDEIKYHVSCMNNDEKHFDYNNADCFNVRVPFFGAPGRIFHMGLVLNSVEKWARVHKKDRIIVYILGCRIGPLIIGHSRKLHKLGVEIFCNPDGLEWKRNKWSLPEKVFLKYCEKCLIINSDLVICDSMNIEKYVKKTYGSRCPRTIYIAYGAERKESDCFMDTFKAWCDKYGVHSNNYYLVVGRFVPENNYESMINEFMKSNTDKDLVIITNVEKNKFFNNLYKRTKFYKDKRIKFVGTVYDKELLMKIREEAYGYLHGHEVGGTNPSLLEALSCTKINLLFDIGFNKEVGKEAALYWNKESGNLCNLIEWTDSISDKKREEYGIAAKKIIDSRYSWEYICNKYENIFLE